MSVFDDCRADLADLAEDADLGTAATWQVYGSATPVPCSIEITEDNGALMGYDLGESVEREARIVVSLRTIANPGPEDVVVIAAGDHAGTWRVSRQIARAGGLATVRAKLSALAHIGARQALGIPA